MCVCETDNPKKNVLVSPEADVKCESSQFSSGVSSLSSSPLLKILIEFHCFLGLIFQFTLYNVDYLDYVFTTTLDN